MQKLKKVDPETLILNFSSSDDPNLETEITSEDEAVKKSELDQDSEVSNLNLKRRKQDYYAFAAYVPPGKHLLVLRDVGLSKFAKHSHKEVKLGGESIMSENTPKSRPNAGIMSK